MSDKIRQAIDEILLEVSDPERAHLEPDVKEKLANKIAHFIAKGVGNPNVVSDLLRKVHEEGKFPANTPKGRGDNIPAYTDRIIAMFSVIPTGVLAMKQEDGKKMLVLAQPAGELTDKQKAQRYEEPEPIIPKSAERRAANEQPTTTS